MELADIEKERYSRQMLLPRWGERGQLKLKASTVFVAGAGGLGSSVLPYLAAAGVGRLRVCDGGRVELSNMNRQVLYRETDIGGAKGEAAIRFLERVNPHLEAEALSARISDANASEMIGDADLIVDCLDNFDGRFLLNSVSVARGIPMVHGGVSGLKGQVTFIRTPRTPCLACMIDEIPPAGVFPIAGAAAGVIGCIQALEALKYLTGTGTLLEGRMLFWDGESMKFHVARGVRNPSCTVCGREKKS